MAVTYRQAGVDIDEANSLIERIKPLAQKTRTPFVLEGIGGFAGLCSLPTGMEEPILVSGTDGVGTKLKVAFATGKHDTIGQDLVAMCVNDIITTGAEPLFFLDYFGTGRLSADVAADVIRGIADGCSLSGCALLGGETAELPGMYADGEYDLAGFSVGVVDKKKLLGPARVKVGDVVLAVASTGLHSNGYSLARRVIENEMGLSFQDRIPGLDGTVGEVLLTPTRIYARTVKSLRAALGDGLHALCHVTGGGVPENLPRVLPEGVRAVLDGCRPWPALFTAIANGGPVELAEMRRTFNLGIGLLVTVAADSADAALASLAASGEDAWRIGSIAPASTATGSGPAHVEYVNDPEGQRG
ncbi:MAG TPA: phosphoribosylformylglycinamidine cyclo-ligase [Polyangiaceae bacterium]|nr:phosphoribosylformylglycinamidine cyclo-ligase [Polyangiaceae bacterium]